ncbi:MAG: hypothetical protein M3Y64_00875, partial [Gemmatimonadota bacterium]|nr:hypothetical protein [Gemmatimonadota bacterium]
ANLVINCTPLGLTGTEVPVDVEALHPAARILDLIARSGETEWVRLCKAHGHVCEDGVRMLIEQGAESFERWFHIAPDRASMWRSLKLRSAAGPSRGAPPGRS